MTKQTSFKNTNRLKKRESAKVHRRDGSGKAGTAHDGRVTRFDTMGKRVSCPMCDHKGLWVTNDSEAQQVGQSLILTVTCPSCTSSGSLAYNAGLFSPDDLAFAITDANGYG